MKLIISHISPDFDALASMALAQLLHPDGKLVLLGGFGSQLEAFIALYRDELELLNADELDLDKVEELIVVDTSDPARISAFASLLERVPVTVYDHHPKPRNTIPAVHGIQRDFGSTVTILTLLLKTRGINIPASLASLALLGIHDDTGNLRYELTQPEDHEAAAHLLREGASLSLVQQFINEHYSKTHRDLFAELLQSSIVHNLANHEVLIGQIKMDSYIYGLAPLCNQLLTFFNADAAFLIACIENQISIIGRSAGLFDVGAVLAKAFNGGGHEGAGFAKTSLEMNSIVEKLIETLPNYINASVLAKDIMTSPVNTLLESDSLSKGQSLLMRFGHNGAPVLNKEGKLIGIISRRDLDKAVQHQMGHAPIKAFMTKKLVTATEDSSVNKLEALIEEHNIGRIPIVKNNNKDLIIGIVSRTDLIKARHQNAYKLSNSKQIQAQALLSRLPYAVTAVIETAKNLMTSGKLYLVGGTVRDLALAVTMQDLELSVEGIKAETLGEQLQNELGGKLTSFYAFDTCKLQLLSGLRIAIASTCDETYLEPNTLPVSRPSSLRKDMERRDFSVNALAIRVYPEAEQLIDFHNGLKDISTKTLRILHPLAFIEDPTRILRGAKLAGRLKLRFDQSSLEQLEIALKHEAIKTTSVTRLKAELELILKEVRVAPILRYLDSIGALKAIFGFNFGQALIERLDELKTQGKIPIESYLLALLLTVSKGNQRQILTKFHWQKCYLNALSRLTNIRHKNNFTREQFKLLTDPEITLVCAFSRELATQVYEYQTSNLRVVQGRDLLALGLVSGPKIGKILKQLAQARQNEQVTSFEEELELAKALISLN